MLCALRKTNSDSCQLAQYYTDFEDYIDPGNLEYYELDSGDAYCYGCNNEGNAFINCQKCGDENLSLAANQQDEVAALTKSVGCAVCHTDFTPQITVHNTIPGL